MTAHSLKQQITEDMKDAMRAKDKAKLDAIRLILAAVKQVEVDERIDVDDARLASILDRMLKQRRESVEHFKQAGRNDLVEKECFEIGIIQAYLPPALDQSEVEAIVRDAVASVGASSIRDMSKVVALVKPQVMGRADMALVSELVKKLLT